MQLSKDPGSTANSAYNLGNIGELKTYTEFLGSTDTKDIYKFSLTETNDFKLQLGNISGVLDTYLYIDSNENGEIEDDELLLSSRQRSNTVIPSTLGAADYFVSIQRGNSGANTNYDISLSATPNPPSIDKDPGKGVAII